ncbi:MAG: hypothetical protein H0T76_00450 [Nannocystis sp.]|nr:hypothetical protein [Nannocystis sp.]MBA3544929.1 hypothetical protein [Nannocystis sp.]
MRRFALALALAPACGREPDTGLSTGPGVTSVSVSSSSTGASSSSSTTTGAEGSSGSVAGGSSGTMLDMGLMPDFESGQPQGCKGKIDFLFLIARNGTMKTEQAQLLASLPGFLTTIQTTFADFDLHVMVANPDGTWPGWGCANQWCGIEPHHCGPNGLDFECGPDTWDLIKPCDEKLGAGVLFNAGPYATNQPCALAEGRRYMVLPGEPEPAVAFDCIARVGTYGPGTPIGEALVAAVSPALNADDGCNAGFLRSDALLVVTMIADTEDDSKTKPADWYNAVVKAKGDPAAVVMLAIQPQAVPRGEEEKPGCTYDDDGKLRLRDLIEMFPFHDEGNTCATSYVPFFETAAGRVAEACAAFIPG